MNVPDSWVKEVCEKLGIPEPSNPMGAFWDGDRPDSWYCYSFGKLTGKSESGDFPFIQDEDCAFQNFIPLSAETIAMIKKDLGIE